MTDIPFHVPLTPAQQKAAGLTDTWPLALADKVRFAELDPLNHVNNRSYLTWLETLRVEYVQMIGLTRYADPAQEPRIVIRRAEMDWLRELRAGDAYITTARTIAYRTTSFTMLQEIWSQGSIRARMQSIIVLLTPDGSARMPIPPEIIERFHEQDGVPRMGNQA